MLDKGISTRRGIMCSHLESAYGGKPRADLRHSEAAQVEGVILPLYVQMSDEDVRSVCTALAEAV
jgi:dTDP-4-amino-4,6-dideoxygalactose transaminase